jgi:hypothetical protein
MPTQSQLRKNRLVENTFPQTRRTDDPAYKKPSEAKLKLQEYKEGDLVEYTQVGNKKIITTVLKVKPDGNLILDTKKGSGKPGNLCKNVCVKPHRVKKV